jgi:hypothetical protein
VSDRIWNLFAFGKSTQQFLHAITTGFIHYAIDLGLSGQPLELGKGPSDSSRAFHTSPSAIIADRKNRTLLTCSHFHKRQNSVSREGVSSLKYWIVSYTFFLKGIYHVTTGGGEKRCLRRWMPGASPSGGTSLNAEVPEGW